MKRIYTVKGIMLLLILAGNRYSSYAQNCSQEEVEFMNENLTEGQGIAASCYLECILSDNQDSCVVACMSAAYPEISDTCMQCAPPQMQCVTDACWLPCLFPNSIACEECVIENCGEAFLQCIGDDDGDGFTVDGGDCDNNDPFINPMAEDEDEDGIDQNCDGVDGITLGVETEQDGAMRITLQNKELCLVSEHVGVLSVYSGTGTLIAKTLISEHNKCLPIPYTGIVVYTFKSNNYLKSGTFAMY